MLAALICLKRAMGCCSLFDLIFGQALKKEENSADLKFSLGSSHEHLLKYDEAKSPVSRSVRGWADSSSSSLRSNGKYVKESDTKLSYEELPLGFGGSFVAITRHVIRSQDRNGKKMINNYVREGVIGNGSYSKVVLCRNTDDGNLYAMKIVQKSRLRKIKVAPSETALTDVLKEVSIMRELNHPNIVKLVEVIDDVDCDRLYLILEHVEGTSLFEGSGPVGGIGEELALRYFRDVVRGLVYLHSCRIIHGDIKPENLLVSADGCIKICDFSVSQRFEGENDELRRSPGTPVYTAPECILGPTYGGRAADVWALGVTLYCMVSGRYPFIGDTLQSTYDEIVQGSLKIPDGLSAQLVSLLKGLLCKDPNKRMTLDAVMKHACFVEA